MTVNADGRRDYPLSPKTTDSNITIVDDDERPI